VTTNAAPAFVCLKTTTAAASASPNGANASGGQQEQRRPEQRVGPAEVEPEHDRRVEQRDP
jgi:hypothetical protein